MGNKEELTKIIKIADRAASDGLMRLDKMSLIMDLRNVHQEIGLRLDEFLNADNENFSHDIIGIQNNINRETKLMDNFFLPRFAKNEEN